ncbi:MAG TPA: PadR family transcriptional regulator [Opitutaceae bacterium]|jgi:transcriptional regulator|nr:PadR family transcriptional regulator [Opitutaceae bacterium]
MEVLQGTLDMLVLRVLNAGPMHGWGIAQKIQILSRDVLQVEEGSIYPALYRMELKGWIVSEWGQSDNNRRAKFYELTKEGRQQLASESKAWVRICDAIGSIMNQA